MTSIVICECVDYKASGATHASIPVTLIRPGMVWNSRFL